MKRNEWREKITSRLVPECGCYYIVYDPDYLLGVETLYIRIKEKGFEIVVYTGEIDFRLLFEEKIRSYTDMNSAKDLVIVVHQRKESSHIPYDLSVTCTHISIDLATLIPSIDPEILKDLPVALLDRLYNDELDYSETRLSYDESRNLLLRKLYGFDPLLIRTDVQLLRLLLHIHYDGPDIPESLLQFVIDHLKARAEFKDWDIELIMHDRDSFFTLLEEHLNCSDGSSLPLEQSEVKVYLDKMVQEGAIYVADRGNSFGSSVNVARKPDEITLKSRLDRLRMVVPDTYSSWFKFMDEWASVLSSIYTEFHPSTNSDLFSSLKTVKRTVNDRFREWLEKSYGSLYNHPPSSPVMVHHLPRHILQRIARRRKVALLVVDGLSMGQWKVMRRALNTHSGAQYSIEEKALFAWIPTLTSVSRQALLSGKMPLSIPRSLYGTQGEEKLWKNFWEDNNLVEDNVGYRKIQGDLDEHDKIIELLADHFQVAAVIVNKVDSILHGQKQGSAMMHKEVEHWAHSNVLRTLLNILFRHYDDIYLTSDHGNDEAVGIGNFSQGVLTKESGQRCRIYDTLQFRQDAENAYPEAIAWPQVGLPENYYSLLAPVGEAFSKEGTTVVTHGGASIDEVIVPLIHFSR